MQKGKGKQYYSKTSAIAGLHNNRPPTEIIYILAHSYQENVWQDLVTVTNQTGENWNLMAIVLGLNMCGEGM